MRTYKTVADEITETVIFADVIDVYEELAGGKLRRIKTKIIETRDFFEGLSRLSTEVGSDFHTTLEHEKPKEASVFIAANAGLFGDIVEKIFRLFIDYVKATKPDVFVTGRRGAELMRDYAPGIDFHLLNFPDDRFDEADFNELAKRVVIYPKITVFYGKFHNLVIQRPDKGELSGQLFPQNPEELHLLAKKRMTYLYEPTIFGVSELFTQEVYTGVLEQMVLEAQLSKLASRVMHLDAATSKVNEQLFLLEDDKRKIKKQIGDKKQNELMAKVIGRKF